MERIPIAQLSPELPAADLKHFKAVVTLIWPFSSSSRQCALLLADPDFRLRRKRGQVRVRFNSSSARAIAGTGIGIGDEVILGLRGAQFVEEDTTVSTPGRSIEWELSFSQTLAVRLFRDGNEIANLDMIDVAPTPAPPSPVKQTFETPFREPSRNPAWLTSEGERWSYSAFLKRARYSGGPPSENGHDPFIEGRHEHKRRRKSYRDWNNWTYSARTPSPEKDGQETEEDENVAVSPSRPTRLPETPISPPKPDIYTVAGLPLSFPTEEVPGYRRIPEELSAEAASSIIQDQLSTENSPSPGVIDDDFERDADYYDLYAGPDEYPPATQFRSSNAMRSKLGRNEESKDYVQDAPQNSGVSASNKSELERSPHMVLTHEDQIETSIFSQFQKAPDYQYAGGLEEGESPGSSGGLFQVEESIATPGLVAYDHDPLLSPTKPITFEDTPAVVMAPPTLTFLQTDFDQVPVPGMLTPIGKEPSSPVIRPLDSSTLPMPSPFPGDRDSNLSSFLDDPGSSPGLASAVMGAPQVDQRLLDITNENNYIVESSFHSSVSSASAAGIHPTHESAFTDVRFTFGMDGSTFSRPSIIQDVPLESSDSQGMPLANLEDQENIAPQQTPLEPAEPHIPLLSDIVNDQAFHVHEDMNGADPESDDHEIAQSDEETFAPHTISEEAPNSTAQSRAAEPEIIMLSSDTESEVSSVEQYSEIEVESESFDEVSAAEEGAEIEAASLIGDSDLDNVNWTDENPPYPDAEANLISDENVVDGDPLYASADVYDEIDEDLTNKESSTSVEDPQPIAAKKPEAAAEIIDLGSGSEESDEEDIEPIALSKDDARREVEPQESGIAERSSVVQQEKTLTVDGERPPLHHDAATHSGLKGSISSQPMSRQSIKRLTESSPKDYHFRTADPAAHLIVEGESQVDQMMIDDAPQTIEDSTDALPSDHRSLHPLSQDDDAAVAEDLEHHPDVKLESIEDAHPLHTFPTAASQVDDTDGEREEEVATASGPSAELLIAIPEGHTLGELHLKSVPATGPARNTRSKTKTSMSPTKEETPMSLRKRRSRRPNASIARSTMSPIHARRTSTVSPVKETPHESPYSLRSRTKKNSPSTTRSDTAEIESPRKARQRKKSSSVVSSPFNESFGLGSVRFEPIEFPQTSFGPSQELGTLQGKFAHVSFVRDSEEGSLHSEHSISTIQYSDDFGNFGHHSYADLSDLVGSANRPHSSDPAYPTLNMDNTESALSESNRQHSRSSITPTPMNSPVKKSRVLSTPSNAIAGRQLESSPSKSHVYKLAIDDPTAIEENNQFGEGAPKAIPDDGKVAYPEIPPETSEHENEHIPSSPPGDLTLVKQMNDQRSLSSLPAADSQQSASIQPHSYLNGTIPMTPDATQQSYTELQPTYQPQQHDQSIPLTPRLTQASSSSKMIDSSEHDVEIEYSSQNPLQHSQLDQNTPRRNVTDADIVSAKASPSVRSERLSDSDEELEPLVKAESPSIGLSTPVSYYTPLRDLSYFLNRSSQFHTSSNPDILAVVTNSTSPPKRAEKGPRDWNTTLRITDLSMSPETRTVQVFRAFSSALPIAEKGDVVLLRSFQVRSLNRKPMLLSGDDSAWCVWRWGKPVWGAKRGAFAELKAREEMKGPAVERGEDEWKEIERLRAWWLRDAKNSYEDKDTPEHAVEGETTVKGKNKA